MVAVGNSGRNPGQGEIAQERQLQLLGGTAQHGFLFRRGAQAEPG